MRLQSLPAILAGALLASTALATAANATIAFTVGSPLLTSTYSTDFNGLSGSTYVDDNIKVQYVGTVAGINPVSLSSTDLSYKPVFGDGYTSFSLNDGSAFDAFSFSAASANTANQTLPFNLNLRVNYADALGLHSQDFSASGLAYNDLQSYTIMALNNEDLISIDAQVIPTNIDLGSLQSGTFDRSIYDHVKLDAGAINLGQYSSKFLNAGAVPEPATWALMIGGFFGIGGALRHRRTGAGMASA